MFKSYTKAQIGTSVTRHLAPKRRTAAHWYLLAALAWLVSLYLVGSYQRPVLTSWLDSRRPSALVASAGGDVFACDVQFSMSTPAGVVVGSSQRRGCR